MTIPLERQDGVSAARAAGARPSVQAPPSFATAHVTGRIGAEEPVQESPRAQLQLTARENRRRHAIRRSAWLVSLLLLDALAVFAAMALMMLVVPADGWGHVVRWSDPGASSASAFAQNVIAICSGLLIMNAYQEGDAGREYGRVLPGTALGLLVLHWPIIWHEPSAAFASYLPSVLLYGGSVALVRHVSERAWQAMFPTASEAPRALFVGRPHEVEALMQRNPLKGADAMVPVAQLDLSHATARDGASTPVNGDGDITRVERVLQTTIHDHDVDTVLLCSHFDDDRLAQIVVTAEAAGCRVLCLSRTYFVSKRSPKLKTYDRTPVVELTQPGIRGRDVVLKRAFDLVAAGTLLLLASPVMLVVTLLVKRSSPGPVLFRQERVGYAGRRFHILKFRSMRADAEEHLDELRDHSVYDDPRLFKMVHDPRVTPLGRFLRKSSLDELPQLFNVIHGSMSLVGPRPPLPAEVEAYGDRSYLRFDVKPGITGPWQVNGRNSIRSFDEVIALEAAYVNGWTIWRDFVILARTVPAVLRMDGAH